MRSLSLRDCVNDANDDRAYWRVASKNLAYSAAFSQDQNLFADTNTDGVYGDHIFSRIAANHQQRVSVKTRVVLIGDH
jgi:hypothetical protein